MSRQSKFHQGGEVAYEVDGWGIAVGGWWGDDDLVDEAASQVEDVGALAVLEGVRDVGDLTAVAGGDVVRQVLGGCWRGCDLAFQGGALGFEGRDLGQDGSRRGGRIAVGDGVGELFEFAVDLGDGGGGMTEVLSGGSGVGGRIATARAYLETDLVLARIVLIVTVLLLLDAALARLVRRGGIMSAGA